MPLLSQWMGLDPVMAGAWIGGTVDSTGAVVAAGQFLGEDALQTAAVIKMIQNLLIGIMAFCIALYWVARVEPGSEGKARIWRTMDPISKVRSRIHRSILHCLRNPCAATWWR